MKRIKGFYQLNPLKVTDNETIFLLQGQVDNFRNERFI